MSNTTNQILIGSGAGLALGGGVAKSISNQASLLNTPLSDVLSGEFTLYVSDLVSIGGLIVGIIGAVVGIYTIGSKVTLAIKRRKDG